MEGRKIYAVQTFVRDSKGALVQGRLIDCRDAGSAYRTAEERVRLGYAVGAAAFQQQVIDEEYDDGSEPITLATFGRVPPGVADQIPF